MGCIEGNITIDDMSFIITFPIHPFLAVVLFFLSCDTACPTLNFDIILLTPTRPWGFRRCKLTILLVVSPYHSRHSITSPHRPHRSPLHRHGMSRSSSPWCPNNKPCVPKEVFKDLPCPCFMPMTNVSPLQTRWRTSHSHLFTYLSRHLPLRSLCHGCSRP